MRKAVIIVGLLFLGLYLATGLFQVRPGERAVVRRFGRPIDQAGLPGLHFGLPWGLDRVDLVPVDEQQELMVGLPATGADALAEAPVGQLMTGDNNLVDVRVKVFYRVNEARVVRYVLNRQHIEGLLMRGCEAALASTIASQRIGALLIGQARNLESLLRDRLAAAIEDYDLGIVIDSVNVAELQPPKEVAEAFLEVNRAREQKARAEREALGDKQTQTATARNQALRERTDADGAFHQRVTQARAEAQSFLTLWQKYSDYATDAPNALLNLYLTEMQAVLSRMQVRTVTDQNVEQTIILPLPEK